MNRTLTAVPGLAVGHATAPHGRTGCPLAPEHLVPAIDAVLLTGGSAFGLAAADGVMAWLRERGRGHETGVVPVPIVPGAVIFDLAEGVTPPDAAMGEAACDAASSGPVAEGRVGAGAGATVGKLGGLDGAMPGGVGSWSVSAGPWTVAALAVVNALGDVRDGDGRIVAGARGEDGAFLDGAALLRARAGEAGGEMDGLAAGTNTTLAVVATDAPLSRRDLGRLLRVAGNALPRRIHPVHTPFDGDVVFALSTGGMDEGRDAEGAGLPSTALLSLAVAAQEALEEALTRAVAASGA